MGAQRDHYNRLTIPPIPRADRRPEVSGNVRLCPANTRREKTNPPRPTPRPLPPFPPSPLRGSRSPTFQHVPFSSTALPGKIPRLPTYGAPSIIRDKIRHRRHAPKARFVPYPSYHPTAACETNPIQPTAAAPPRPKKPQGAPETRLLPRPSCHPPTAPIAKRTQSPPARLPASCLNFPKKPNLRPGSCPITLFGPLTSL